MAKSAGGAPRLADLTSAGYHPLAFRLFLLGGHYRSQLDFTAAAMDAAQATLCRLVAARTQARSERDWARADEIRGELAELGVQVTGTPDGPRWELR